MTGPRPSGGRCWNGNRRCGCLLAWQLNAEFRFDPDLMTEVEIRMTEEGENRTRVDLEHRRLERLGDQAEKLAALVGSPNGWGAVLGRYAESCSP